MAPPLLVGTTHPVGAVSPLLRKALFFYFTEGLSLSEITKEKNGVNDGAGRERRMAVVEAQSLLLVPRGGFRGPRR